MLKSLLMVWHETSRAATLEMNARVRERLRNLLAPISNAVSNGRRRSSAFSRTPACADAKPDFNQIMTAEHVRSRWSATAIPSIWLPTEWKLRTSNPDMDRSIWRTASVALIVSCITLWSSAADFTSKLLQPRNAQTALLLCQSLSVALDEAESPPPELFWPDCDAARVWASITCLTTPVN